MKIEFGPGSKILGTKKVSDKGQISGLKEFAGKEVMVVLVSDEQASLFGSGLPHEVISNEIQRLIKEQISTAQENFKKLNEKMLKPEDLSKEFIDKMGEEITKQIKKDMDKWLKNFIPGKKDEK